VQSSSKEVIEKLNNARPKELLPEKLKVHFIHGKCTTFIDEHNIHHQVGEDQEIHRLSFDYCVFSTGRRKRWPFDTVADTEDQHAAGMQNSKEQIEGADVITVIGGGALGIEIAGEIKHYGDEKR
jgi:pyruvate/2-oxoglutarate dehydrogenase complex dihydrolipoamide dehydrogenase (E3) component